MTKKILVAAIAAAVSVPMAAMADATVYGKVNVASQYMDRDTGDSWGMEDQASRLGIKGSEDLGAGLKAIYQMEFGVNVGDGFGKGGFWSQRNSYVGLAGDWGTALAGRHDTPHKISSGKLDFFADTAADYDTCTGSGTVCAQSPNGVGLFHSLRVDGAIAYISPNFSGLTVAGAVVQTGTDVAFEDADDFASAYSLAAMYSQGPFFGSLSYETLDPESLAGAPSGTDDDSKWRAGFGILGMSGFSASVVYENRTDSGFVSGADSDAWQLQAAYDFGKNRVKGMYGQFDGDNSIDVDFDTWAIGLEHNLSKRTQAQVLYRAKDFDDIDLEENVFGVQLNHAF
jgi:predicted porin